jgi:hypothetical protein
MHKRNEPERDFPVALPFSKDQPDPVIAEKATSNSSASQNGRCEFNLECEANDGCLRDPCRTALLATCNKICESRKGQRWLDGEGCCDWICPKIRHRSDNVAMLFARYCTKRDVTAYKDKFWDQESELQLEGRV